MAIVWIAYLRRVDTLRYFSLPLLAEGVECLSAEVTMTEYTRREIRRLRPEIRRLIEEAGAKRDSTAFIKWLQKYGNHLSLERQAEIVAEFKRIVSDEGSRRR